MKRIWVKPVIPLLFLLLGLTLSLSWTGCKDEDNANPDASYQQVNLVANSSEYNAAHVDTNLVNAWGLAIGSTGAFWISSTEKDRTT
ncbi:MAG TPA: hypothetical protein VJ508_07540, partial [Saprospiraceae bacterium]|nr:hypothetical protein [Saprospiraceae bacterium]